MLDSYDTGYWSRFDLDARWHGTPLASPLRHGEHVVQLERLAGLSGSKLVAATAARWGAYAARTRSSRRAWWGRLGFWIVNRGLHPSEY